VSSAVHADEVRAVLAEHDENVRKFGSQLPDTLSRLESVERSVLTRWLDDPAQVTPAEIGCAEAAFVAGAKWWERTRGADPLPEERARRFDLLRRMREQIADEPVDADEVRAALDENADIRARRGHLTASERALGIALDRKLRHYLADPATIDPGEVRNLELLVAASGHRRVEMDGRDPYADIRRRRVDLLARIRGSLPARAPGLEIDALIDAWAAHAGLDANERSQVERFLATDLQIGVARAVGAVHHGRKRSQTAPKNTRELLTRDSYQAADQGVGSDPVSTMTKGKSVGERISKAREAAGLNRYQLAKLAGVNYGQVRQWEINEHVPTPTNLRRLIPHIGGTTDFYLFGDKAK
jgi:hypothetical protein